MKTFLKYITEQADYFADKARAESRINNSADRIRPHFKEHGGGFDAFEAHARNGIKNKALNKEIIQGHPIATNTNVHHDIHGYLNAVRHVHGVYGTESGGREDFGEPGGHLGSGAAD